MMYDRYCYLPKTRRKRISAAVWGGASVAFLGVMLGPSNRPLNRPRERSKQTSKCLSWRSKRCLDSESTMQVGRWGRCKKGCNNGRAACLELVSTVRGRWWGDVRRWLRFEKPSLNCSVKGEEYNSEMSKCTQKLVQTWVECTFLPKITSTWLGIR